MERKRKATWRMRPKSLRRHLLLRLTIVETVAIKDREELEAIMAKAVIVKDKLNIMVEVLKKGGPRKV